MNPVWIEFPNIPWGSLGWRMGFGEVYWTQWHDWFRTVDPHLRLSYKAKWPEPEGWTGFYAMVEEGKIPPHISEERVKVDAAGGEPRPDELKILDVYRCRWLLKHYLKGPRDIGKDIEFRGQHGDRWLLVAPTINTSAYLERLPVISEP
ncbi:hypothetical protein [Microcoleus sp. M2_C2]|uniref:hypothetical protein n=1 Tax=unclassified Microcoleus TaxID=2642155 RepID=UPI002FD21378